MADAVTAGAGAAMVAGAGTVVVAAMAASEEGTKTREKRPLP